MLYCVCGRCYRTLQDVGGACVCGCIELSTCKACTDLIREKDAEYILMDDLTGSPSLVRARSLQQNALFGQSAVTYGCQGYCKGANPGLIAKLQQMNRDSERYIRL